MTTRKRLFALLLCLVMLAALLPTAAFAEEAEELTAASAEPAAEATQEIPTPAEPEEDGEEEVLLTAAEAEELVLAPAEEEEAAAPAAEPETNPVVAVEATEESQLPPERLKHARQSVPAKAAFPLFLSPDEEYYTDYPWLMQADQGDWELYMVDDDDQILDRYIVDAVSSNPDDIWVWVEDGRAWGWADHAGFSTITMTASNGDVSVVDFIAMFTDVTDVNAFYFWPVYYALYAHITTGTTPTTFAPFSGCTRSQIVTFLWRAMGEPEPTVANPFKDIKSTDFCYKAVLWAYENGITTGTTPTTFSPNNVCTREQCVTFLWRASGEPSAYSNAGFKDVAAGKYYEEAVNWAFENEITTGINSTKFGVGLTCTRAQIVTFIWRW